MSSKSLLPVLFIAAGLAGWGLVWLNRDGGPAAPGDEDPEPELKAPQIQLPPARQAPPPSPTAAVAHPPAPDQRAPAEPEEAPMPAEDPNEPPDPTVVLELPEHLQGKPEAEKRQYFIDLKAHHEGMMQFAEARVEELLDSQDPEERAAGFKLRNDLKDAKDQLVEIDRYLRDHPE